MQFRVDLSLGPIFISDDDAECSADVLPRVLTMVGDWKRLTELPIEIEDIENVADETEIMPSVSSKGAA